MEKKYQLLVYSIITSQSMIYSMELLPESTLTKYKPLAGAVIRAS